MAGAGSGFANFGSLGSGVLNFGSGVSGLYNTGGLPPGTPAVVSGIWVQLPLTPQLAEPVHDEAALAEVAARVREAVG